MVKNCDLGLENAGDLGLENLFHVTKIHLNNTN